jgi:DNA-binding response OmpR family regulator
METKTILVVEDDKDYRKLLYNHLTKEGYRIQETNNGALGIDLIKDGSRPDLVLVDFMMPHMSGIEFIQELKNIDGAENIKTCMLTAKNTIRDVEDAFNAGVNDYIIKDHDPYIILDKIRTILQSNKATTGRFISQLEVTNIVCQFEITEWNEKHIIFTSSEEFPTHSIIQIKSKEIKEITGLNDIVTCVVDQCEIQDDKIIVTCDYLKY